jgi:hypothetical protein
VRVVVTVTVLGNLVPAFIVFNVTIGLGGHLLHLAWRFSLKTGVV